MAARDIHREALTTRPLFLFSLARKTRSGNKNFLPIQSIHAKAAQVGTTTFDFLLKSSVHTRPFAPQKDFRI